jgi:hypothetical protein
MIQSSTTSAPDDYIDNKQLPKTKPPEKSSATHTTWKRLCKRDTDSSGWDTNLDKLG